ncbi:MAG: hypothetical protein CSA35_09545 [Dethiosulfovibrio peptidovorans]|nr:MAG: hypothetical protein CSA35_09545 [Dethiosulfovibrio peptidovorans]
MRKHLHRIWKNSHPVGQVLILLTVVVLALALVVVVDVLSHPEKSWTESTLVRMIVERRSQN